MKYFPLRIWKLSKSLKNSYSIEVLCSVLNLSCARFLQMTLPKGKATITLACLLLLSRYLKMNLIQVSSYLLWFLNFHYSSQCVLGYQNPFFTNIKKDLKSTFFVERRHPAMCLGPKDTMKTFKFWGQEWPRGWV